MVTVVPSIETIRSPGFNPAAAAGATGSDVEQVVCVVDVPMHSFTRPRVVVCCAMPNPHNSTAHSTIAISRFIVGPPSMMMMRFQGASL